MSVAETAVVKPGPAAKVIVLPLAIPSVTLPSVILKLNVSYSEGIGIL